MNNLNIKVKKISPPTLSKISSDLKSKEKNSLVDKYKETPPVYVGLSRLLRWGNTSSAGMTASFVLNDVDETEQHPFKGLRAARATKTEGQRLHVSLQYPTSHDSLPEKSIYSGESLLLWWAEDCAEGMKLTIKFRDGPDGIEKVHPCDGMISGKKSGELISLVVWEMDDQEMPTYSKPKKKRRFSELSPTTQSHILCRDIKFFNWIKNNINDLITDDVILSEIEKIELRDKYCEHVIKYFCSINSRADFSRNDENGKKAVKKWREIVERYENYKWS
jgi:hypothetical protein